MPAKPIIAAVVAGLAVVAAAIVWQTSRALPRQPVAGLVRQTEIRVAPEVGGRLATVQVRAGQHVAKGDTLAAIDNPDLVAALGEARAAEASARAERARIYSGVRAEEIEIAAGTVRTAQANLVLAQQQNVRAQALAKQSFASGAQLDESNASLAKAVADLALKQADLAQDQAGPTLEQRAVADARLALASAAVATAQARLDKTRLVAPADGVVGLRIAEPGEVMLPGKPVLTLDPDGGRWFAFTLREDELRGLTIGTAVKLAQDRGDPVDAVVTELRPLGEFATWRAARAVGDHDLAGFGLRLDPTAGDGGLSEGMTVLLPSAR